MGKTLQAIAFAACYQASCFQIIPRLLVCGVLSRDRSSSACPSILPTPPLSGGVAITCGGPSGNAPCLGRGAGALAAGPATFAPAHRRVQGRSPAAGAASHRRGHLALKPKVLCLLYHSIQQWQTRSMQVQALALLDDLLPSGCIPNTSFDIHQSSPVCFPGRGCTTTCDSHELRDVAPIDMRAV